MEKKLRKWYRLIAMLLALVLAVSFAAPVMAEEETEEEETEYIPEEYYAPVESNEISGWPQGEAIQAAAAVVMDLDTNTLLYSKDAYSKRYPASITKIMTAMLSLEKGNLEDKIVFSEIVYDIESESSHAGIQPGEEMTLEEALNGLMLESANDIANGLAEHFSGSISAFAEEMNAKAEELGCVNTHFTNPHGLHNDNHYTCAYDMALIAQAAYAMPEFRKLASTTLYTCPETNVTEEVRYFLNHHKMIQEDSDYYVDWCKGGKTGFTSDAWNTLVTYGEKDGMRLVCVILHDNGAKQAYLETTDLMEYGFSQFEQVHLVMDPAPTFYEAMRLNYPGMVFQADSLKIPVMTVVEEGTVTVPSGIKAEELSKKIVREANGREVIEYDYEDWPVGSGETAFSPIALLAELPFEEKRDMDQLLAQTASKKTQEEVEATAMVVLEGAQKVLLDAYMTASLFVNENTMLVICLGALVLVILIILVIVLICRCTKESRIRRKRHLEELERLRMEEEIEKKTTDEIEEELRAAMEQERLRKEREKARQEEQKRQEEELQEIEKILNGK